MTAANKTILRTLLVSFGVLVGLWVVFGLVFYAFLGPSNLNVILATVAYVTVLGFLFTYKRGDLWQRLFPGSPRPRAKIR